MVLNTTTRSDIRVRFCSPGSILNLRNPGLFVPVVRRLRSLSSRLAMTAAQAFEMLPAAFQFHDRHVVKPLETFQH
jgi:hypothetical protein